LLLAIGAEPPRGLGREVQQRADGAAGGGASVIAMSAGFDSLNEAALSSDLP
jgi:hypothetical protein